VEPLLASLLGFVARVANLASAFVLSAFIVLGIRPLAMIFRDPGRRASTVAPRLLGGLVFLGLGLLYAAFTLHALVWDAFAVGLAAALALALVASLVPRPRRAARRVSLVGFLTQLSLLLALLLMAALTLMRAGFLSLTEDRPVLIVDVTGDVGAKEVSWAAPDQPPRRESLPTHRVVFRTPEGAAVAEAWVYGDQVAVKGRVLRLSPVLNAAGVANLFELQFAHNGYATEERHGALPHQTVPLSCGGPLAVHPWWRPIQARLLEAWEKGTESGSGLWVRSATTESTYFPLVDGSGRPMRRSFRVVLTPGGLSAS